MSIVILGFSYIVLGMTAGFLSGLLGIGGGIIIIPALCWIFKVQGVVPSMIMYLAVGTSLATVACNGMLALRAHRKHQTLNWRMAKILIPSLLLGSVIGPSIALQLPTTALQALFGLFLMALSVQFIFFPHQDNHHGHVSIPMLSLGGLGIGIISSMLGFGGGVFIVPLLSRAAIPMKQALAVAMMCLIPGSILAAMGYAYRGLSVSHLPDFSTGFIYWPVVGVLVLSAFFFTPMGVRLAHQLPQEKLKRLFGIVIFLVAIQMLYTAWGSFHS